MLKPPLITVIDRNFALKAQIDIYTSFMLNRRWQSVGDWQLVLPATAQGADKLTVGNIIILGADGHRSGYIESVSAVEDDRGVTLTVKGKTLQGLTSQRITLPDNDQYNYGYDNVPPLTDTEINPTPIPAETILKTYAVRHLTDCTDLKRRIPALVIAADKHRGRSAVWSSRLEQLSAVFQDVSEYCDCGYEIYADLAQKQFVFDIITGTDRSSSQSENSRVIFSKSFDNILNCTYDNDVSGLRNIGYAGGKGEGADRVILKVTPDEAEPEGWERREVFIDCGQLEVVETDTAMSLSDEGLHKMKSYTKTEALTATVADTASFAYLKKWDLGDKVTVVSKTIGVQFDTRITAVTERYEGGSSGIDVTFGSPSADLGRVISRLKTAVR